MTLRGSKIQSILLRIASLTKHGLESQQDATFLLVLNTSESITCVDFLKQRVEYR